VGLDGLYIGTGLTMQRTENLKQNKKSKKGDVS
jgi:hypothetical protein